MIRRLQISTAVALMVLLGSPAEGSDDLGTGVSWRRAVLNAIQTACAEKSPSLCPSPDQSIALDSARTPPGAPTGGEGVRTGPASEGGWVWGPYGEFRSFRVERLNVRSSTATVRIFQGAQQVQQQQTNNTDSIRANYSFRATNYAGTIGVWAGLEKSRIAAEVRGGVLFADAEIEQTGIQLNTVTKTGGNDWGGTVRAYLQVQPKDDGRVFVYGETGWLRVHFDAERDPAELIPGATIESDTSDVTIRLFTAGAGAGFFFDQDRKSSIRAGIGLHQLDASIDRSLQFVFSGINQRQEFKGRIELDRTAMAVDVVMRVLPNSFLELNAGASIGSNIKAGFATVKVSF